jgi:hypothetical protein
LLFLFLAASPAKTYAVSLALSGVGRRRGNNNRKKSGVVRGESVDGLSTENALCLRNAIETGRPLKQRVVERRIAFAMHNPTVKH